MATQPLTQIPEVQKGDIVRIETSNPHVPFYGGVTKIVGGTAIVARCGSISYKAPIDEKVVVLRKAGALAPAFAETNAR